MPPLIPLLVFLLSTLITTSSSSSSSPPHTCSPSASHIHPYCPPLSSPPHYPFSTSPGCNHPSFRIYCATPHSLFSINSLNFSLRSLNSTSFSLSFTKPPSIPVNFSSTPFRLFPDPCPALAKFTSCSSFPTNYNPSNKQLLRNPLALFSCPDRIHRTNNAKICKADDISALITNFTRIKFWVKWNLSGDPYNISCSNCNGSCGFNDTVPSKPFLCFPDLGKLNSHDSNWFTKRRLLILLPGLVIAACIFVAIVVIIYTRKKFGRRSTRDSISLFINRNQIYPPVFTYDQLRSSTDGFDPRRKIGDGGFGSVYLANFADGRIAAVKRLHRHHPAASTKSFCNEIMILSSLRHPNLVRLHGYCYDPRGLLLVYDYVPNGTLADHLHGSRSLYRKGVISWSVRVDVALQVADALEYLHFSLKPPVVHRDITSSNIFVEKDMRIKVGDFGLSRLLSLPDPTVDTGDSLDEYVCCTGPQGTPGYLDPEYHRSFRLTEKSDVYSFGVVLLELITGMKAVDMKRDKRDVSLADLVVSRIHVGALHQVVDPVLVRQGEEMISIEAVAELAFRCVAADKDDRPNARELVEELKRIRGQIQDDTGKQGYI